MENILKEIHTSISSVELERTNENLSKIEKTHLENTLLTLRNMERSIINKKNDEMLLELSTITPSLTELINEMELAGEKSCLWEGAGKKLSLGGGFFSYIWIRKAYNEWLCSRVFGRTR